MPFHYQQINLLYMDSQKKSIIFTKLVVRLQWCSSTVSLRIASCKLAVAATKFIRAAKLQCSRVYI